MTPASFMVSAATILLWGVSAFLSKLAADRIGTQGGFWQATAYAIPAVVYGLVALRSGSLAGNDVVGVALALLAGIMASAGLVGSYFLLARAEASRIIPLVGLYPALSAILAFAFLHESLSPRKLTGILLCLASIYLLGR